ncbi:energy transducer TonB [Seongchinamella unica]|uniref:Energy transducer TonB n=1 Tax=Seongchinamella unica TaxID=2547392 RepID=A0A4R5LW27_9GAMM|nr:energy transducer TonB [Seongchinamella unica]TDG15674.1 energy transducer TonB [Seongchinamella unica]
MYYLEHSEGEHKRMRNAVLVAAGLHVLLAFAVSFSSQSSPHYNPQIEVTLATRPSAQAPDEARHIAQQNQKGSGQEAELEAASSQNSESLLQSPTPQQSAPRHTDSDTSASGELLSTVAAAPRVVDEQREQDEKRQQLTPGTNPEVDPLTQQLASLEATLDEQTQAYANRPRVRRLTSVSAKQAADAAYLADWRQRLEAVGNKYYPEASVRYGLYGDLRLLVVIRKDGSLEDIKVLKSSGYAVLDEAALKIVRMAAPYSPFPAELAATTDKLEIIRTWQFQENELGSN